MLGLGQLVSGLFFKEEQRRRKMLQDIAPHQYDNTYCPRPPHEGDLLVDFHGHEILLKPDRSFFTWQKGFCSACTYLFALDDKAVYWTDLEKEEHQRVSVFEMRWYKPQELAFTAATAYHLVNWMQENRFCGTCGHPLELYDKERALRCPHCGRLLYPRINPAVIVGILNDHHQLLITRYANGPYRRDALVAGFVEIGETFEDTVHREVKEETGLEVDTLQYYKSQPWGFSGSVLFGVYVRTHGDVPIRLQKDELAMAAWKNPEDEFLIENNPSLTAEMIRRFQKGEIK